MAAALGESGYVVDSSVTPYVSWRRHDGLPGRAGGPDFRAHDAYPFRVTGAGEHGLVELPVTVLPTNALARRLRWLRDHWQARPLRLARRALRLRSRPQPLWLRPLPEYGLEDLQALLLEAERLRLPYAVLMFHSSELLAGASPYRPAAGRRGRPARAARAPVRLVRRARVRVLDAVGRGPRAGGLRAAAGEGAVTACAS